MGIGSLGGRRAVIAGGCTGSNIGIRLQRCVAVLPRYGVQRRPLRVQRRVRRHGIAGEVPCVGAGRFLVPAVEAVAVRGGRGGLCRLLPGFNRLRIRRGAVVLHVEGDGVGVIDVVVGAAHVGVDFRRVSGDGGELLAGRVGLTVRVVRLINRVGAGIRVALEVAAGNQGGESRIGVVVLIGVGRGLGCLEQTSGDAGDLGVGLVVDGVVARGGAVGVNLRALADLADHRELAGRAVAVQDAVAVGVDVDVLDRADLRAGKERIVVHRRPLRAVGRQGLRRGVRRGRGARVEAGAVIVDRAALCLAAGDGRQGSLTAVDGGDDTGVGNDRGGGREGIALADQVDGRRVVVIDNDVRLAAGAGICRAGGAGVGRDVQEVIKAIACVLQLRVAHVRQRIGRRRGLSSGEGAVLDRPDVAAVVRRVVACTRRDRAVINEVDRCGIALIVLGILAGVLRGRPNAGAGIILHRRLFCERTGRGVMQGIVRRRGDGAVFQRADMTRVAEGVLTSGGQRQVVDHVNGRGNVGPLSVIASRVTGADCHMRIIRTVVRNVLAVFCYAGNSVIAVHDRRIVAGRERTDSDVGQGPDVAQVDQHGILALERDAVDRSDRAALFQVSDVGRFAEVRGAGSRVIRIIAVVIQAAVRAVHIVVEHVIAAGRALERQVRGVDGLDVTAVQDDVVAAAGPGAGAGDAQDRGRIAVGAHLVGHVSADLVAVGVGDLRREDTGVLQGVDAGGADVHGALDALDDTAGEVLHRIVGGRDRRGAVRVLIGLDVRGSADLTDHAAAVHERVVTVGGAGRGILGVDLAVDDLTDGGAVRFLFLIIICTEIAAAGRIHLLPHVGVIPPVGGVVDGISRDVAL